MNLHKSKTPVAPTTEVLDKDPNQLRKDIYIHSIVSENLKTIEFHGDVIETLLVNDEPSVVLKPICDAIGLNWRSQLNRIQRDDVLKSTVAVVATVAEDGGHREMITMPVKILNGWLFGISVNRVKPELRVKLTEYRRKCFDVLADYWQKGVALNPRAFKQGKDDVLTVDESNILDNVVTR